MTRIANAAIDAAIHPTSTMRQIIHIAARQLRWDFSEVLLAV